MLHQCGCSPDDFHEGVADAQGGVMDKSGAAADCEQCCTSFWDGVCVPSEGSCHDFPSEFHRRDIFCVTRNQL